MADKNKKGKTTVPRRDNFTQAAIQIIYKRAGGKCCRCGAPTFGPVTNNLYKSRNIGQGAHIAAAASGGPRYDPKMTKEERSSAANGMWMCSNCHDIIDRDVEEFPTKKLKEMKREAEERAKKEMGVATLLTLEKDKVTATNADVLSAGVSAAAIVDIRKSKAELLKLNGAAIDHFQGEEFLSSIEFINFSVDSYLTEVGSELIAYFLLLVAYCKDGAIRMEVVRRLKELADQLHDSWGRTEVTEVSELAHTMMQGVSRRSKVYQSAAALLKDLASYKELRSKRLNNIPNDLLKGSRESSKHAVATEEIDTPAATQTQDDSPPTKRSKLDESARDEGDNYLLILEQLAGCENEEEVLRLEHQIADMGYEANIV